VKLDVCICTRNPRRPVLAIAIRAIARQAGAGEFEVLLVDNGSSPPVEESAIAPLRDAGIPVRIVRHDRPGIAHTRLRAIQETRGDWILFVDDDNELCDGFIMEARRFIAAHPQVGCLGGKLLLPPEVRPPRWAHPFLPYLGVKDAGENVLTGTGEHWGLWEPPTAGAFVRRDVAEAYRARAESDARVFRLGRNGSSALASCEDSLMMRQTFRLGALNAYLPCISLRHHLAEHRFQLRYLVRLMRGFGASHVLLEHLVLEGDAPPAEMPSYYRRPRRFARVLVKEFNGGRRKSFAFGLGMAAYHWGRREAYLAQERGDA
jgi:glycosyltransferase involved in cell wall biosynthesis